VLLLDAVKSKDEMMVVEKDLLVLMVYEMDK